MQHKFYSFFKSAIDDFVDAPFYSIGSKADLFIVICNYWDYLSVVGTTTGIGTYSKAIETLDPVRDGAIIGYIPSFWNSYFTAAYNNLINMLELLSIPIF